MSASLLSSHRLHWGAHKALSGNLLVHLGLHVHDTPEEDIPILLVPEPEPEMPSAGFSSPGFSAPLHLPEELGY
ncbi:hypothetical protein OpiT1DRAFT_03609 [Opitutaceae bacterium TAV1]|nr:hypothetical protein OPIT5_13085 [Opitutaceae bacterium TAV5]EIP99105.1 hypothetical protein OpiT1DRAFT_03609 [Opitutaceae bacterium TAV1]